MAWLTQEWERLRFMNGCAGPKDDDLLYRSGSGALWPMRQSLKKVYEKYVLPLENVTLFGDVYDRPLEEADFLAPPILLIVPAAGTRHRELVSQVVGCCIEDDGLVSRDGFTIIFNDLAPKKSKGASGDASTGYNELVEDHWHYELSTARNPGQTQGSFQKQQKKKNKSRQNKNKNEFVFDDYDDDDLEHFEDEEGPECTIIDGVSLAKQHSQLLNFQTLVEEMGVGFLMDHLSGLCVASYPASKVTVVVAPEFPVAKREDDYLYGGRIRKLRHDDDDDDAVLNYSYATALRFFACKADRIIVSVDPYHRFSTVGVSALETIRRYITKTSIDIHFPPTNTKQKRNRRQPRFAQEIRRVTRLIWNLGKIYGTRTKFPKLYGNLFRSSSKVDSLFKRGEEDFCRDLFYLNQCSVLRRAEEICQRGDLSGMLAHLANKMQADAPVFTLPFKVPNRVNISIPGTKGITIPLWNRTMRAKERILYSLEYYMIRVQRLIKRVPLSHFPAPDFLRDVLVYKDMSQIPTIPENIIHNAFVTSNDKVNRILARMIQVCNVPSTQYDLKSKVFVGKGDYFLLNDKERALVAVAGFNFDDLLPDPYEKVTLASFVAKIGDGLGPGVASRIAYMAHQNNDLKITRREFLTALHLMLLRKSSIDVPPHVPARLIHPMERKPRIRLAEVEPLEELKRRSSVKLMAPLTSKDYHKRMAELFTTRRSYRRSTGLGPEGQEAPEGIEYILDDADRRAGFDDFDGPWPGKRSRLGLTLTVDSDANFLRSASPGPLSTRKQQQVRESVSENQTAPFSSQSEQYVGDTTPEVMPGQEDIQESEEPAPKFTSATDRRMWARKILGGRDSGVAIGDDEGEVDVRGQPIEEEEEIVAPKMPNLNFLTEESGFDESPQGSTTFTATRPSLSGRPLLSDEEDTVFDTPRISDEDRFTDKDMVSSRGTHRTNISRKSSRGISDVQTRRSRDYSPVLVHSKLRSSPFDDRRRREAEDQLREQTIPRPHEMTDTMETRVHYHSESVASRASKNPGRESKVTSRSQVRKDQRTTRTSSTVRQDIRSSSRISKRVESQESDVRVIKKVESWRREDSFVQLSKAAMAAGVSAPANLLSLRKSDQKIPISRLTPRRSQSPIDIGRHRQQQDRLRARSVGRPAADTERRNIMSRRSMPPDEQPHRQERQVRAKSVPHAEAGFDDRRQQQTDAQRFEQRRQQQIDENFEDRRQQEVEQAIHQQPRSRAQSVGRAREQGREKLREDDPESCDAVTRSASWWKVSQRRPSKKVVQEPPEEVYEEPETEQVSQQLDFLLEPEVPLRQSRAGPRKDIYDPVYTSDLEATPVPLEKPRSRYASRPGASGDGAFSNPYPARDKKPPSTAAPRSKSTPATSRTSRTASSLPVDPYGDRHSGRGDGPSQSSGQKNKEKLTLAINPRQYHGQPRRVRS